MNSLRRPRQRAGGEHRRGERQGVGVDDPLQPAEAGVEVVGDLRQRRVHHGDVEHEHGRGHADHDQCPTPDAHWGRFVLGKAGKGRGETFADATVAREVGDPPYQRFGYPAVATIAAAATSTTASGMALLGLEEQRGGYLAFVKGPDPLTRGLFTLTVVTSAATFAAMAVMATAVGRAAAVVVGVAGCVVLIAILVVCLLAAAAASQPAAPEPDPTAVRVGSVVRFRDARTGRRMEYRILPDEQALKQPLALPESSPAAQALLGAQPGDDVAVVERNLVVEDVIDPAADDR